MPTLTHTPVDSHQVERQACAPAVNLRPPRWAAALFGYELPRQRASFWEFVYRNGVPHVRVGPRKILFNEVAVMDWLARRNV